MDVILTFLFGLLLRLGIPIIITSLLFTLLHRLDNRWQKEALAVPVVPAGKPCWEVKGCSEEKRKECKAFAQPNAPCWQVFRTKEGNMKEECLGCAMFRRAPIPFQS